MPIIRKIIKTGNSLALTIPAKTISDFNLKEGDVCTITVDRTKSAVTYLFTGHPRQLTFISRSSSK
jgi:antitoxin component of MazEF toxin-antitoxin module